MSKVVKNNMSAVRTLNTLNKNSSVLQKSLAKVSSGMKVNSAKDDASGYAISERMRVQIRSLDQANQNTQNASSLVKTAEGAVSSTVEIVKTMKEKAIDAATDTNTDIDRLTSKKNWISLSIRLTTMLSLPSTAKCCSTAAQCLSTTKSTPMSKMLFAVSILSGLNRRWNL